VYYRIIVFIALQSHLIFVLTIRISKKSLET